MTQKESFIKPCDPVVLQPFQLPQTSWVFIKNKNKFPKVKALKKLGSHKQNFGFKKHHSSNCRGK